MSKQSRIKRDVVDYQMSRVYPNYPHAYRQVETLSCGHRVHNKGAIGRADFRFCKQCERVRDGYVKYEKGTLTMWNPEKNDIVKVPYTKGLVPYVDKRLSEGFTGIIETLVRNDYDE